MRTNRRVLVTTAAITLASTMMAAAATARPRGVPFRAESKLWFDGTSTVRSFSCAAGVLTADVQTASATATAAELVRGAELAIPVASIDCRNGQMNGHMRKALKSDQHAAITWTLSGYRVTGDSVVINGRLTIAGRTNPIELRAAGVLRDGVARVTGATQIRMTEFGIQPPRLMLGALRVNDAVTVNFDVAFNP